MKRKLPGGAKRFLPYILVLAMVLPAAQAQAHTLKGSRLQSCTPVNCIEIKSDAASQGAIANGLYFNKAVIRIVDTKFALIKSLEAGSVYFDMSQGLILIRDIQNKNGKNTNAYFDLSAGELAILANN